MSSDPGATIPETEDDLADLAAAPGGRVGRFELLSVIGSGGMGVVFAARDPVLDRRVAIKMIRSGAASADIESRLLREAQGLARLTHPNVVTVHEAGTLAGDVYLAMELVDGTNLSEWSKTARPWREVVEVFIAAGRGLAAAHAAGLVHRDFKPANVLIDRNGHAKVGDFGLVAMAGQLGGAAAPGRSRSVLDVSLTDAGAVMGTPAYMAPEQRRGESVDARADQYAFCVALWEVLHGTRPVIDGDEIAEPAASEVPPRVRAVLRRGLSTSPAERWPSMDALLGELRGLTARSRWPIVAAVVGAAAVATVAAVLVFGDDGASARAATAPSDAGPPRLQVLDNSVRRLTVEAGCEEFPSFTPDGKTLLYDAAVPGGLAIFSLDVESGQSRQLTHLDGWSYKPMVSPDGTRFAFMRDSPGSGTWIAPLPAGEPARQLVVGGFAPSWSSDPRFVWAGMRSRPARLDADTGVEQSHVEVPTGLRAMRGVEGPDGQLLAVMFHESGQGAGLALLAPDAEPRWLEQAWYEEALTPLPGGTAALASRMSTGGRPLVTRVGFDGTVEPLAVGEILPRKGITMTPDGGRVAWSTCHEEGKLTFVVRGTDGKPRLENVAGGDWNDRDPTPIPGTSQMVIASDRGGAFRLWVVDVSGTMPARPLPSGAVRSSGAAVSLDGAWVVYSGGGKTAGGDGLMVLALDGSGTPRPLTTDISDSSPAIAADGYVYFVRTRGAPRRDIMRIPLAGGEAEVVVEGGSRSKISPDGTLLLYLHPTGRVLVRDLETGTDTQLSEQLGGHGFSLAAFSSDGRSVAIISNKDGIVVDRATGDITESFDVGADQLGGVAFVEHRLVVARVRWEGDLWIAETRMTP